MKNISLHLLDIIMNCTNAGATEISIAVTADRTDDRLIFEVADNGSGIDSEKINDITDPFYSTRKTRRIGLGLPLLKQSAEQSGGSLRISSAAGEGTNLIAEFGLSHIDRPPTGDLADLFTHIVCGTPEVNFIFTFNGPDSVETISSRDLKTASGLDRLDGKVVRTMIFQLFGSLLESAGLVDL